MVRLHLLGFTRDLKGVVFGQRRSAKKGSFWVPIDDDFLAAVEKLERARKQKGRGPRAQPGGRDEQRSETDKRKLPPVGRSQPSSGLPASEIQQMLRRGRSAKSVAETAKAPLAWVERLAEPVLTERAGVVRLAQRAIMSRPRLGPSGLVLGEAIVRNLQERRATTETIEGLEDAWDARATAAGTWRVSLRFSHRGRRCLAEWEFRKGSREILPRNRMAAQLGWWPEDDESEPEPVSATDTEEEEGSADDKSVRAPSRPKRKSASRSRRPRSKKRIPARSSRSKRAPSGRSGGRRTPVRTLGAKRKAGPRQKRAR